jgi:G:T-mismatch repair DNA endonuclease (very short patch repair protein)
LTKKSTTVEFVKKAREIHGDKYDYSCVEYKTAHEKVKIKCNIHGFFYQKSYIHLQNHGCSKCANILVSKKLQVNHEDFVKKANKIHKNKYKYPDPYLGNKKKIKILCPKHGEIMQTPENHLLGSGCGKCSGRYKKSIKDFIKDAKKIHGEKYDYSLANYKNNKEKINIVCKKHGLFRQTPNEHLNKKGCKKCSYEKRFCSLDSFVQKAQKVHGNKYDYSLTNYTNSKEKINIVCKKHGLFKQTPKVHLEGSGCQKCSFVITRISKNQQTIYDYILKAISPNAKLEYKITVQSKIFHVDIFIPETNTVVEYYGDYWHCNPKKYDANYFHPHKKMYAKDIWKCDNERMKKIKNLGYNTTTIWESDFKNISASNAASLS